eukprot:Colp12_sorted_trinity150504_noHs@28112
MPATNFGSLMLSAVKAVLQLLAVAVVGAILSRRKILSPTASKDISNLVFHLFLPCLLFHGTASYVTLESLKILWVIPVYSILFTAIGCGLGYLTRKIFKVEGPFKYGAVAAVGFQNAGTVPLALLPILAKDPDGPFAHIPEAAEQSVADISMFISVTSFLLWTIAYNYLEKAKSVSNHTAFLGENHNVDRQKHKKGGLYLQLTSVNGGEEEQAENDFIPSPRPLSAKAKVADSCDNMAATAPHDDDHRLIKHDGSIQDLNAELQASSPNRSAVLTTLQRAEDGAVEVPAHIVVRTACGPLQWLAV